MCLWQPAIESSKLLGETVGKKERKRKEKGNLMSDKKGNEQSKR
jgi:hypothetical protein